MRLRNVRQLNSTSNLLLKTAITWSRSRNLSKKDLGGAQKGEITKKPLFQTDIRPENEMRGLHSSLSAAVERERAKVLLMT